MRGWKKVSDEHNDEKTQCVAFDGGPVAANIMESLAKFPAAHRMKPGNSSINIQDLNRVTV